MKPLKFVLSLLLVSTLFAPTLASSSTSSDKTKLKTDHDFSDLSIFGKYQQPDQLAVTVEEEKQLLDLLALRKKFDDRTLQHLREL